MSTTATSGENRGAADHTHLHDLGETRAERARRERAEDLQVAEDSARVMEPFTDEGIYYAVASGELAAKAIALQREGGNAGDVAIAYSAAHSVQAR